MRVATYRRISTDEEHQPYSLEAQSDRLAAYVASQDGWDRVRDFSDQCSGATLERPGLQRALREASAGRFDLLLVYRVDRLARSVRGLAQIVEDLDRAKVAFRSATEPFDTTTSAGRMMVQMLGVFAEFERATIVDRVVAGMERKASRGLWTGGNLPFGYVRDAATGFLTPEAAEAAVVPLIFRRYAQRHDGARAIAEWLNNRGHRTRLGKLWSPQAVLTVLRNRVYIGDVFFRGTHHSAPHPKVVDEDLFKTVQAILVERGDSPTLRRSNSTDYLLSGLVTCGLCGHHYIGTAAHGRNGRYRYYTCWSRTRYGKDHCAAERIPATDLDDAVVAAISETFDQTDLVTEAAVRAAQEADAQRPQHADQLEHVAKEIAATEESIERYLTAFEAKTMPENQCGPRVRSLSDRLTQLRLRQGELRAAIEDTASASLDTAAVVKLREQILNTFRNGGDTAARKAVIRMVIQEVKVENKDEILSTFKLPSAGAVRVENGLVPPAGIEPASTD